MLTAKQKGFLRRLCPEKKPKKRIYYIKREEGEVEVRLRKPYSLMDEKGNKPHLEGEIIRLLRAGEEISFFRQGVAPMTIERYASGYEFSLRRRKNLKKREENKNAVKRNEINRVV